MPRSNSSRGSRSQYRKGSKLKVSQRPNQSNYDQNSEQQSQQKLSVVESDPEHPMHGMIPPAGIPIQGMYGFPPHLRIPKYPTVQNVPVGLESLHFASGLSIDKEPNLLEIILPLEFNNRYSVHNPWGQRIYFAGEKTDCCTRHFFGQDRSFKFSVYDPWGREILLIERHCTCSLCYWGGRVTGSVVSVRLAQGGLLLGTVVQDCNYCYPKYRIVSPDGTTLFRIKGDSCSFLLCNTFFFTVHNAISGLMISEIIKPFAVPVNVDHFGMLFVNEMDARLKAVFLGALICIDFNFYKEWNIENVMPSCTGFNITLFIIILLFAPWGGFESYRLAQATTSKTTDG